MIEKKFKKQDLKGGDKSYKEGNLESNGKEVEMANDLKWIGDAIFMVIAFVLGGTGLSILYGSQGDLGSVVGGFALIGISIAILKKYM